MPKLKVKCIKESVGFTTGETYSMLGCAGEYIELIDDNKEKVILFEGNFEIISRGEYIWVFVQKMLNVFVKLVRNIS